MPTGAAPSGEAAADNDEIASIGADAAARTTPDMATSGSSRMKKPCDPCKRQMDHLDEKNPSLGCFLRHMTSSLKHIMIVPNRFLKHFVGKLSQTIKLESPNGRVYNVEVTERCNKILLRHGWEEFVSDHHIEENDFLLFQHIQNSVYKVLIFDSDGSEKIICWYGTKSIPSMGCFLGHMTSSLRHIMIVPNKFLKQFVGKLSKTIELESPNGSVYNVEVMERYKKMVLRHGWEEFVGDHHIEENDFLLFRHIENSVFKVLIFDFDGCEKIICCDGIKTIPSVGETRVDYVDTSSSSQFDTIGSSGKLSSRHGETMKMTVTSSSSGGSGEDIPSENESFESDDLQAPGADYIVPNQNYLSQEQKEGVALLIQEIQPETTVYVAVMQKSHVHPPAPSVDIIEGYAFAYFPHGNANVTLQTPGKSKKWHPEFNTTKGVYRLQGQWLDFVHDNHVQEGDICAFLPAPAKLGREFTFIVYLLRAAASRSRSETGFQMARPCPGGGSSPKIVERSETRVDYVDISSSSQFDTIGSSGKFSSRHGETLKMTVTSSSSGGSGYKTKKAGTSSLYEESGEDSLSGYESIQSDHVKALSEHNYVLSPRCHLTAEQVEKIVALVKKIQPEIPVLVVQMKKSYVNLLRSELVICKGYAAQHFPQESQYVTLECRGKKWRPRFHVRPNGRGCILSMQWQNFARDNSLQEDDVCLFQPMPSEKGFRVMVHLLCEPSTRSSSSDGHVHGLRSHMKRGVTSIAHVHEKSGSMDTCHCYGENSGSLDLHKCRAVQQVHQVLSDCGGPSSSKPPLYVVLDDTCLTPAQDKAVREKAMAIKAEVSIFVATMNKKILGYNNDTFILDFSDTAQYLPDGKQALTLRHQGQGRAWRTNLHNRLILATGEWHEFVHDSGLEEGDICLFEPMKNERLAMLVHIVRSKQYS